MKANAHTIILPSAHDIRSNGLRSLKIRSAFSSRQTCREPFHSLKVSHAYTAFIFEISYLQRFFFCYVFCSLLFFRLQSSYRMAATYNVCLFCAVLINELKRLRISFNFNCNCASLILSVSNDAQQTLSINVTHSHAYKAFPLIYYRPKTSQFIG